jgi:hypothetical protein
MLTSSGGYSAEVDLQLVLKGQSFPLAQVGPTFCILQKAMEFEPTAGEIVIVVDGRAKRVSASFPQGGTATDPLVHYIQQAPLPAEAPALASNH